MKVKQIANTLNTVFNEIIGESAVIEEDLSNIVSVGQKITSSTQFGENFDKYVGAIIDKVGKTVYVDRVYTSAAPNIIKDSWEYGSILEKVRCDVDDYKENKEWELTEDTTFDVFKFNPVDVKAKYFNLKTTFQTMFSITKKQMKSAFTSAASMNSFISMIENRIAMKMTLASDSLVMRTIVNLIAEKIKANNNVVNLLAEYKKETGDSTITAATALSNKEFLRFSAKTVMQYKKYLATASMLYNNDGYITFTPPERLKSVFITDFAKSLETTLYADTFNKEFVQLSGYSEIPYWQGSGTTNAITDRTSIDVKPASSGGLGDPIKKSGIVGVLFDEYAAMVCNEEPDVRSIYNPEGNFYNYWHSFDASYYNDLGENVVVFTIED
jgi:hypothetical protein